MRLTEEQVRRYHDEGWLLLPELFAPDEVAPLRDESAGIETPIGKPGGVLMFHGNSVHGSAGNITPFPRRRVYLTLNAVSNYIRTPTRAEWIAHRDFTPIRPVPADALRRLGRGARRAA
jgi:ectoine hydroxylase